MPLSAREADCRLDRRRQERWPEPTELDIRYRGSFAYVNGITSHDDSLSLLPALPPRLTRPLGLRVYLASKDGYEDSVLPHGSFTGSPEEALDCACGLYLDDVSAWSEASPGSRENF